MDAIAFLLGAIAPIMEPRETPVALPENLSDVETVRQNDDRAEPRWPGHWATAKYL